MLLFIIAIMFGAGANECAPPPKADVDAILAAPTAGELDVAAAYAGDHIATKALYRSRRLTLLATPEEERRFFRALPRNERELRCVYTLTHPGLASKREIDTAVYELFGRAARIARNLGIGHDRVVRLALWSDGELATRAWEAVDWLRVNDPELTEAAIRRLPRKDRQRLR